MPKCPRIPSDLAPLPCCCFPPDERHRIARDIHDEIGQAIAALRLDLDWLGHRLGPADALLQQRVEAMGALLEQTADGLRRITQVLRSAAPPLPRDFARAVTALLDDLRLRLPPPARLEAELRIHKLPFAVGQQAYGILREALANAVVHAGAQRITVLLRQDPEQLLLAVQDDGCGFDPRATPEGHFGLLGIQERAQLLGGAAVIRSHPGRGTRVEAWLPLSETPPV